MDQDTLGITLSNCSLDSSLTNQLAISQDTDWSTCRLVNSPTASFWQSQKDYGALYL